MKKTLLTIIVFLITSSIKAQAPEAFSYQAVIRDTAGLVISNQSISMKISILQGSIDGEIAYSETHNVVTNKLGLINLKIGNGFSIEGDFSSIPWGKAQFFTQIELDASGGTNYSYLGTSQLLAVPYALYAKTSGNNLWQKIDNGNIYYNNGSIGVGTDTPTASLNIKLPASNGHIFGYEILFKGDQRRSEGFF